LNTQTLLLLLLPLEVCAAASAVALAVKGAEAEHRVSASLAQHYNGMRAAVNTLSICAPPTADF
jgi:hypothetical protein